MMPNHIAGAKPPNAFGSSLVSASISAGVLKIRGATRVLIVEDQLMIADMTEEYLLQNGYEVCGIARTVDEAVSLGRCHQPDVVILDLRLADGGLGTEVAAQLAPFTKLGVLYVTANVSEVELTGDQGHACLNKPYRLRDLLQALEIVSDLVENVPISQAFPRGFRVLPSANST